MNKDKLYIAYGSNLNLNQMSYRCPTAELIGTSEIKDYELLFRGRRKSAVATVEPLVGSTVPVLLWKICPQDEFALDRYEGFPNFYRKELFPVELEGRSMNAMVYVMNDGHSLGAPSDHYLNVILEGYRSAGFDTELLDQAVERSIQMAKELEQKEPEQLDLFGQKWW